MNPWRNLPTPWQLSGKQLKDGVLWKFGFNNTLLVVKQDHFKAARPNNLRTAGRNNFRNYRVISVPWTARTFVLYPVSKIKNFVTSPRNWNVLNMERWSEFLLHFFFFSSISWSVGRLWWSIIWMSRRIWLLFPPWRLLKILRVCVWWGTFRVLHWGTHVQVSRLNTLYPSNGP